MTSAPARLPLRKPQFPSANSTAGRRRRVDRSSALFMLPWAIGFAGFVVIPVVLVVYWSFTNFNLLQTAHWAGLANYKGLLGDQKFWLSLRNTAYVLLIGVPAGLVISLGSALLLNRNVKGQTFYRTAIYLPSIVPPVAGALVWIWILNPNYGLLNAGLHYIGVAPIGWLSDPAWAKISLLIMVTWGAIGGYMVIFLAALQEVPSDLYEAAEIDGASPFRRLRHITLPMLGPVIFYVLVVSVIFWIQFFEQAFVTTSTSLGAPGGSTLFYSVYLYQDAFSFLRTGTAAAMAVIMFVVTLIITGVCFGLQSRFVFYGGQRR